MQSIGSSGVGHGIMLHLPRISFRMTTCRGHFSSSGPVSKRLRIANQMLQMTGGASGSALYNVPQRPRHLSESFGLRIRCYGVMIP